MREQTILREKDREINEKIEGEKERVSCFAPISMSKLTKKIVSGFVGT